MTRAPASVELWGVGTLLQNLPDSGAPKLVLGTGGGAKRRKPGSSLWDIRWVRGPMTAARLGLPKKKGLGDSAILWSGLQDPTGPNVQGPVGLVPHWKTARDFDWTPLARETGLMVIDPTQTPAQVTEQLKQCSRVITESLHGAIFSDTLGIPWAPVVLSHRFNQFKWLDWLATIDREFQPFIMDRPLVASQDLCKSMGNRLMRGLGWSFKSFRPHLRPVRAASPEDIRQVTRQLRGFASESSRYTHSSMKKIHEQRQRMLEACEKAAADYGVAFLKAR